MPAGRPLARGISDQAACASARRPDPADPDLGAGSLGRRVLGTLAAGVARTPTRPSAVARGPRLRRRLDMRLGGPTRLGAGRAAGSEPATALAPGSRGLPRPQRDRALPRAAQAHARNRSQIPQTRSQRSQPDPPRLHPLHDGLGCTGPRAGRVGTRGEKTALRSPQFAHGPHDHTNPQDGALPDRA